MALSATVVAASPGMAWAVDDGAAGQGWSAGVVRLEPLSGSAGLTVAGTGTFRGAIEVRRNGGGLAVVNDLPLEEYVRGIDEVPPSWPAAALQAQAIAARTYAAHKVMSKEPRWRAVGADICATPTCQVYRGLDAERRAHGYGWLPAVEATAGRALLAGGSPIMASYSSTANGPVAMSQNGALAMANEGRSAGEILETYYGMRPTPAAGKLPRAIKVALVMSTASVRVASAGTFRVVDGTGSELAASATGEWRLVPAGNGVRVMPPQGQQPAPPTPAPALAAEVAVAAQPAAARRAARVVTASGPRPSPGLWGLLALTFVAGAGTGAIRLAHRRAA
ncbi:MAG TPA: SpoIID/LytB domain-containing protein [Acidimicrobiales bacterium]|nr:SpoIID/LytB domain-containing protein [Acidimicrobiales bacterium]